MDLVRWSAIKKLICSGFTDKDNINTEDYFDHIIHDSSKKRRDNRKDDEKFLANLKKKNKHKKKKPSKRFKNLDIDCRICFSHQVHDINPVVYCSKYKLILFYPQLLKFL